LRANQPSSTCLRARTSRKFLLCVCTLDFGPFFTGFCILTYVVQSCGLFVRCGGQIRWDGPGTGTGEDARLPWSRQDRCRLDILFTPQKERGLQVAKGDLHVAVGVWKEWREAFDNIVLLQDKRETLVFISEEASAWQVVPDVTFDECKLDFTYSAHH